MRIERIGTFGSTGDPMGWNINPGFEGDATNNAGADRYCLGVDRFSPGSVDVNGVEIVEWTLARRVAMGLGG